MDAHTESRAKQNGQDNKTHHDKESSKKPEPRHADTIRTTQGEKKQAGETAVTDNQKRKVLLSRNDKRTVERTNNADLGKRTWGDEK